MRPSIWTPDSGLPDGQRALDWLRQERAKERAWKQYQRSRQVERWRHVRDPRLDPILERQAAVAHVQTVNASDNDTLTGLTGPTLTTSSGNLLAVVAYGYDPGLGNPTVTNVVFNSVTNATPDITVHGALDSRLYIFHFENIAAVTGAVTGTVSAAAVWIVFAIEISGCATASALDGAGSSATGSSTAPAPGAFSAAATTGFTLSAFGAEIATGSITGLSSPWVTPTNGTKQDATVASREAGVQYQLASPASVNGTWTISSAPWAACQVVYKVAAAGGATRPVKMAGAWGGYAGESGGFAG